jgi:3-hydroxyacyl-CoA dehydrogenase
MGAGIAESAALAGLSVVMVDVREEALDRGRVTIEKDLDRRVKKGRLSDEEVGLRSAVSRRPPPWRLAPTRRWSSRP